MEPNLLLCVIDYYAQLREIGTPPEEAANITREKIIKWATEMKNNKTFYLHDLIDSFIESERPWKKGTAAALDNEVIEEEENP